MNRKLALALTVLLLLLAGGGFYYLKTDYRMTMNGLESRLRMTEIDLRDMDMTPANTIRADQLRGNLFTLNDLRDKCRRLPDWAVSAHEKDKFLLKIEFLEADCNQRLAGLSPAK